VVKKRTLFALFHQRVFHNSFPFKHFRTLSKKCRVYGVHTRLCLPLLQKHQGCTPTLPKMVHFGRGRTHSVPPRLRGVSVEQSSIRG
jgi:hypothetical protein